MIGVGIIGAGEFAHKHARAIIKNSSTHLIAACRRNEVELTNFINQYNIFGYSDYRELLKNNTIDAVVICTPHHLHHQIATDAAKAGKHILLEKPMAHNLAACDDILKAVKEYQVKFMVGHIIRYMSVFAKAKKLLDEGVIGELVYASAHIAKKWDTPNRRDWHYNHQQGGGMLKTVGIHYVDLLTWLYQSTVESVKATVSNPFFRKEADDAAVIFLNFTNGKSGLLTSTGFKRGAPIFEVVITGTKGIIKADLFNGLTLGQDEKWQEICSPVKPGVDVEEEALVLEWQDFSEKILTCGEPSISGDYGRHIIEIVDGAILSSMKGREVLLNAALK